MSSLIIPIVEIESLEKAPNSDTLLIAKFKDYGWQSLVKEGNYKVSDKVIFVPPDSILPEWIIKAEKIEYLRNENGRTRSVKLRGTMSHGILLPLSILNMVGVPVKDNQILSTKRDLNIAEKLGITKWEAPIPAYQLREMQKQSKFSYKFRQLLIKIGIIRPRGKNTTFPEYTHIEHLDNFFSVIQVGMSVWISEKIHGTNFRVGWALKERLTLIDRIQKLLGKYDPYYFTCGSHKVEYGLNKPRTSWYDKSPNWNLYQKKANEIKDYIPKGYIIYAEIYGNKIQDLGYGLTNDKTDFVIYDVMESKTRRYLNFDEFESFVKLIGFSSKLVPILYKGKFTYDLIQEYTSGQSVLAKKNNIDQIREGIVIKPAVESFDSSLGRVVLKSINNDYRIRKNATEFQ